MTNRELLELIAAQVGHLTKGVDSLSKSVDSLQKDMMEIKNTTATKQDIVRLENNMDTNDKALFDGYKLTYEKLVTLENKVDTLSEKVETHDVEIQVVKRVK